MANFSQQVLHAICRISVKKEEIKCIKMSLIRFFCSITYRYYGNLISFPIVKLFSPSVFQYLCSQNLNFPIIYHSSITNQLDIENYGPKSFLPSNCLINVLYGFI